MVSPFVIVIAGPNGSGKSTLTNHLLGNGFDFGTYINPDDTALTLEMREPQRSLQAQRLADLQRDACIASRLDFSFETVMSHPSKIDVMLRAHDSGYDVTLFFVATSDPEINIARVENRVAQRGHHVPHHRISARYERSLGLLCAASLVARRTVVFDNSSPVKVGTATNFMPAKAGLRPVAEVARDGDHYDIVLEPDLPQWTYENLILPLDALSQSPDNSIAVTIRQYEQPF